MKTSRNRNSTSNRILVTGGTGFLGRQVLEYLREKGERQIHVLTTSTPKWLKELDVDVVEGSITSKEIVELAVEGVSQIYHLAGRVSREDHEKRLMYAVHVEGTRLLCEASKKAGVKRIVMSSSSGTIAITEDGVEIPDESYPVPIEIISKFPYYASKLYQEKTARSICGDQVEIVMLNPSLLLGPGDDRLSSTQDVLKFLARDIPAIPSGGMNFVDVRDAAPTFHAAMQHGTPGECYLLGGPNWTLERFFKQLERISKVEAPKIKISKKLHSVTSKVIEGVYDTIGKTPPVEPVSMEMSRYFWYADSSKAKKELGFTTRDPGETLYDTIRYIRSHFLGAGIFD
jgi:nucleoside-diphosphate-sugar epimerase